MTMKIAVIGAGGREHALAWKLELDVGPENVFVLPGNGGTVNNIDLDGTADFEGVKEFCTKEGIDLVVVGPEAPLADGIVDYFAGSGIKVFGPSKEAAQLESSKVWAKQFMRRHGVATAEFEVFEHRTSARQMVEDLNGDLVIKFDGLAGGKGVYVCRSVEEALTALDDLAVAYGEDARFIIEQRLEGQEISLLGFTDGKHVQLLTPSQDHKQLLDGDRGPNTGGMGAFCPVPGCDEAILAEIDEAIIRPTMRGLAADRLDYRGVVYFGVMVTPQGPRLLEYNVRLGDPETEVVLPKLKSSLADLMLACFDGRLESLELEFTPGYYVDVVLASGGYPGGYETGFAIEGLDSCHDAMVFHAGTRNDGDRVLTAGGRVLNVVARGDDLDEAIGRCYEQIERIKFENMYFRTDIGRRVWDV